MSSESENRQRIQTALIAGCGYVGHRVAQSWAATGVEPFACTRDAAKAEQLAAEGIRPVLMDLSSPEKWPELPAIDVLLWSVGFDRSAGADRTKVWIDGLRELLSRVQFRTEHGRVIYTSSTGVYGDSGGEEVDEETVACPDSEGGKACLAAEQILHEYSTRTGHAVTVLRLAGIYGPNRLLRRIADLQNGIPITSPPDDWLNLIHVDDIVRTVNAVANRSELPKIPVMNVVAANSVTRRTYYSTLAELASAPSPVFDASSSTESAKARSGRGSGNRRVISRVRSSLNVEFQYDDVRAGLRDAMGRSDGSSH
jgi:nucleoside-diphosphate-sugar epimerase